MAPLKQAMIAKMPESVTIPYDTITRFDAEYTRNRYEDLVSYYGYPQRYVTGVADRTFTIETSSFTANYPTPQKATTVKRRIYLIQDEDKVRVIALGFRQTDADAIETWAAEDDAALALDVDPAEVDVRWLTPPATA